MYCGQGIIMNPISYNGNTNKLIGLSQWVYCATEIEPSASPPRKRQQKQKKTTITK
jgi:hypothetical protein